jgi:hypothetical protein
MGFKAGQIAVLSVLYVSYNAQYATVEYSTTTSMYANVLVLFAESTPHDVILYRSIYYMQNEVNPIVRRLFEAFRRRFQNLNLP